MKKYSDIIEERNKKYYIFIYKRNISIQIYEEGVEVRTEIEDYLNAMFEGMYIGLSQKKGTELSLEKVNVHRIGSYEK